MTFKQPFVNNDKRPR